MTDETDNTPLDGDVTDNVELSDDDNSEEFDYFDPDEDTEEVEQPEETDDEPDEDEAEEGDDQEAEDQDDEQDPEAVTVKMDDGSSVSLGELKKGYFRQSDYTRKTQELANTRKTVEADVQRMERITETFVNHLHSLVPEMPDASLALSDPGKYTAQKAQHEASMAQVHQLVEMASVPKEISAAMSEADRKAAAVEANEKLVEMFPEAADGEGRRQFFDDVQSVANDLGFSDEELGKVTDHRMFGLAYWAQKGMAADRARTKAKAKVAKAPPATPRKPGQGARKANGNANAMRKLNQTGSIQDALAVDFD